ncbi:MAG: hypothetical protein ABIY55_24650 [Kofleriaceae bacterium]
MSLASGGGSSLTGCGVKLNGTLWCWGDRMGGGAMGPPAPVQVGVANTWSRVTVGTEIATDSLSNGMSCATKYGGSLWCWGFGAAPIPGIVTTPVPVR